MIFVQEHPDYGITLFRGCFAHLLAESWKLNVSMPPISGFFLRRSGSADLNLLSPLYTIDGEWPRLMHMNQPLHPGFFKRPMMAGCFVLAGQFRQASFYSPHRNRIREEWFSIESKAALATNIIVFATPMRLKAPMCSHNICLRPTPMELHQILPGLNFRDVLLLVPPLLALSELRPDYESTNARMVALNQEESIAIARHAEIVVANLTPTAWWAGFLSHSLKVLQLTYGGEDRPCSACETSLVGKQKLIYQDAATRQVDLPLDAPEA